MNSIHNAAVILGAKGGRAGTGNSKRRPMREAGYKGWIQRRIPMPDKFWIHVDKSDINGCWPWKDYRNRKQYGVFSFKKKLIPAHRMAWQLTNGPIPHGLLVCHHCDNPPCCNPSHLFVGTDNDNHQDCKQKNRRASFAGENSGRAKLTEASVREIRSMRKTGRTYPDIAKHFGVTTAAARFADIGFTWKHVV